MKQQKGDEKFGKRETAKTAKRCHSCGQPVHYATDCPIRSKSTKCFGCQEFDHIAAKCPKKGEVVKDSCNVSEYKGKKYNKTVTIENQNLTTLIDTGSDLSLMRANQYIKLEAPKLVKKKIKFRGIGSQNNTTLGEYNTLIEIDGVTYPIVIFIVSDMLMQHGLLIGTIFLNNVVKY